MEILAFILSVMANEITEQEAAAALSAYVQAHPEAVINVDVASVADTKSYLSIA